MTTIMDREVWFESGVEDLMEESENLMTAILGSHPPTFCKICHKKL
jgi:hypothetical protein